VLNIPPQVSSIIALGRQFN